MEGNVNFVLKLSLEEMALRKVVVNLWKQNDILAMIQNFQTNGFWYKNQSHSQDSTDWIQNIEKYVQHNISNLILPESLKERMMRIVGLIGHEILCWKIIHEDLDACLLDKLSWSSSGVIEYKTTAEKIVSLETLDVMNRYRLACLYCLEDHIRVIWETLPEENKRSFYDELESLFCKRRIPLEVYWAFVLKGEESALDDIHLKNQMNISSFNEYAFLSSARGGNKAATEYFFQNLDSEERHDSLLRAADLIFRIYSSKRLSYFPKEKLCDVLFHLINLMPLQERMKIFQIRPGDVLKCLLDWPWQDSLTDIADFIWTFLPESECYTVMCKICNKIPNIAYNFPKLFQDFVLRVPTYFRKEFLRFLPFLEYSCDALRETIQSIIRDADLGDRAELVSSFGFFNHLMALIAKDDWQTVETYLREAKLSNDDREIVKEAFEEFFKEDHFLQTQEFPDTLVRSSIVERLFRLLNESAMNS